MDELSRMIRECSLCGLGQTAPNPVLTTMRHFRTEFEDHLLAHHCEAGVCQDLALSPCENSCPLRMNIPRFIQLYKENRIEEAFAAVIMDNPLPASTGRVCQHPCDKRCRRQTLDESVNIRDIHRQIADAIFSSERFDSHRKADCLAQAGGNRPQGRRGGRRPDRPHSGILSRLAGTRGHCL